MHVLESAYHVTRRSIHRASLATFENRVLSVRLTNGTHETLHVPKGPCVVAGACTVSFQELAPGEAGTIRFSSSEGSLVGSTKSWCHHAGAVELVVGQERLLLAQAAPIGQSIKKNSCFAFRFAGERDKDVRQFYKQMPQEFMGLPGASSSAAGKEFTAYAMASSPYEVD